MTTLGLREAEPYITRGVEVATTTLDDEQEAETVEARICAIEGRWQPLMVG